MQQSDASRSSNRKGAALAGHLREISSRTRSIEMWWIAGASAVGTVMEGGRLDLEIRAARRSDRTGVGDLLETADGIADGPTMRASRSMCLRT